MATKTWNKERAGKRIDARMAELPAKDVEIKEYVRDTDLRELPAMWPGLRLASIL